MCIFPAFELLLHISVFTDCQLSTDLLQVEWLWDVVRPGLDRCDCQLLGVGPVEVVQHQVGGGVGGVDDGVDVASNGRADKYRSEVVNMLSSYYHN